MNLDLSCPDWAQRLREGRGLVPDLRLPNAAEGDRAVAILNRLRLYDVPGTPTMGEAGGEWFRRIVWALFASLDPATKTRMIRELFLLVPKKNNKTTGGALLMLTALLMNERPRAPFLLTGPVHKTADDAFAAAEGAIALDNVLAKKLHVRDHLKTIVHRETQAKLEIMTFDPDIVTGKKVVGALIDEHHVLGKMARAGKAMIQLRGGMQPFAEAFLAIITTQSDEPPAGVFADDLLKAREIRDGKRAGAMLPVLYEFPREVQQDASKPWLDAATWAMVNPNTGLSIDAKRLQEAYADEAAKGDAALRTWASQHLNIEIGVGLHSGSWAGADFWEQQARPDITLELILERCDVATVGLDGGGLRDLYGLCVLGRDRETGDWLAWFKAFAHPSVIEYQKELEPRLRDFEKAGDLMFVKRVRDDIEEICRIVKQLADAGLLERPSDADQAAIGVDRNGIDDTLDELEAAGIALEQIKGIAQGAPLMAHITTAERRLAGGELWHSGSALMNWCVGNAKTERKGNAVLVTKEVSKGKIDPLMALFNAVALMSRVPAAANFDNYLAFVAAKVQPNGAEATA